jgi:hypothetical protein
MNISISNLAPVIRAQAAESMIKADVDQKQSLPIGSVGAQLDAQVLMLQAKQTIGTMTPQQLNQYLDTTKFSESESQAMMGLFLATVAMQEKEESRASEKDPVRDLMSFDPGAWEKHIGVLVAAIVAVNIARKSSAEMSGMFTQMAHEAAVAQGVSIMAGGEAAMWAAVSGAVVASVMTIAGAGLSVRGQNQKHADIKTNKANAAKLDELADTQRLNLKARSADITTSNPKQVVGTNAKDELETIGLKSNGELGSGERAVLESEIRSTVAKAKEARMKSALQEKTYANNLTVGGAISALAMITSSGLSSILRLQEYAQRQNEVLHQSEQSLNKAISDTANQSISEDTALISKMLDAIQQMVDSRSSTMSNIASARA